MKGLKFLFTLCLSAMLTVFALVACNPGDGGTSADGRKTLVMATSADYPPYEFVDSASGSPEVKSFDVGIAKPITEQLDYNLVQSWNSS